jgi:hypothetical protein
MHRSFPTAFCLATALTIALRPAPARAGEPIPDVDVILEQIPGGVVVEVPNGAPFDRLELGGSKAFLAGLQPERLPSGWSMTREGKNVVLSGPARSTPTRLRLQASAERPKSVDWDVSLAGKSLASKKGVVPRGVPPFAVKGSLQGLVVMPEEVSPGEPIAMRPLPGAELPAGGRFVLSGVVTEELPEDPGSLFAVINTTRSNIKSAATLVAPAGGIDLEGPSGAGCADLAPLAAVLVAGGTTDESCPNCKSFFESRSNTAKRGAPAKVRPFTATTTDMDATLRKSFFESRSNTARGATKPLTWEVTDLAPGSLSDARSSRHDAAMNAVRNLKFAFEVTGIATGDEEAAGFAIDEKGVKLWQVAPPGAAAFAIALRKALPMRQDDDGKPGDDSAARWVALTANAIESGCRFTRRSPDLYDLARMQQKPRDDRPAGKPAKPAAATPAEQPPGPLQVARIPDDLPPGAALSLQYIDRFGDVWLDVPAVPGTRVVAPSPVEAPAPRPCLRTATRHAQSEDTVCVCGDFPAPESQLGIWIDGRSAGDPVAISSRSITFRLPPHALGPGAHRWSGDPQAGFGASCVAETQVIFIRGEIDSQRLLRGESTPMRLTVSGTQDSVPIRIRNLTPAIITIDGGEEQTIESTGGAENTVTRSVRGTTRGNFNVAWTLAGDRCPCER